VTRRGWLLFAVMCVLWGIPYLLIKVAVRDFSPVAVVFLRTGIGAVVLLPVVLVRRELGQVLRAWRWVLIYTAVEVTIPWLMLSAAEERLPSSLVGLLVAAVPLVTAILLLITRADDRVDWRRGLGLLIGFAGVAALLGLDNLRGDGLAVAEMAVVIAGYAVGPIIIARRLGAVPATGVIAVSLALTAILYAPFALATWPSQIPSLTVVGAMLALGVLCTAVAFLAFFALIAEAGPARAQTFIYVNPVVALLLGVLLLGEPFGVADVLGLALILGGLLLATRRRAAAPATAAAVDAEDNADTEDRVSTVGR
jgi:drug/metabolite transporter (DMT)-like permease